MSTMLEQAIIDAEALRETALKNAEAQVIEKYSDEIKEAVHSLLEQPEDPLAGLGGDDPAADPAAGAEAAEAGETPGLEADAENLLDKTPAAAHEGENLCPCPEKDDVVTIDLNDMANKLDDKDDELEPHDVVASQITSPDSESRDDEELRYRLGSLEDKLSQLLGDMEQPNVYQESVKEDIEELIEKLTVDIEPKLTGWAGRPESDIEISEQEILAALQSDESKEDREAMKAALKKLEEANKKLQNTNDKLSERNHKLEDISIQLRDRLVESNLSNARLLYTNKVLGSNSLNGRQKTKIVEAISKAESVEEAKTIFETLQSTVGSTRPARPESLSEAVNRTSSTILPRARNNSPKNPMMNRWKTLAGISADKKD